LNFSTSTKALLIIGDSRIANPAFLDADTISGGTKSDWLDGGIGDDTVSGKAGPQRLVGGIGHDFLTGGTGADTLAGGDGDDKFFFNAVADSNSSDFDTITDFDA